METRDILEEALKLTAAERFELMEKLQESLDRPDPEIDRLWGEEAVRRAHAFDSGRASRTYSVDEALGND
jgi:hypothetical protein